MRWHGDPATPWVAVYRVLVLLALLLGLWLGLDTRLVYDPLVRDHRPTPTAGP